MTPPRRALVVVAHADDETLGCGGTVVHLVRAGWQVDVVVLSDGIVTARGARQDNREDAAAACEILGTGPPRFLGFADQRFDAHPVSDLAAALEGLDERPALVLTHGDHDLNRDHRLTSEAARIAWRPLGGPVSILEFSVAGSSAWNGRTAPAEFYVDVTDTLDVKLAALARYRNEARTWPHPASAEAVTDLARVHGTHIGTSAAEAFHLRRGVAGQLP